MSLVSSAILKTRWGVLSSIMVARVEPHLELSARDAARAGARNLSLPQLGDERFCGEIVIHRKGDYQYNLLHLMQLDKAGESEETTCQENIGFIYCVEVNLDDVVVIRLVGLQDREGWKVLVRSS